MFRTCAKFHTEPVVRAAGKSAEFLRQILNLVGQHVNFRASAERPAIGRYPQFHKVYILRVGVVPDNLDSKSEHSPDRPYGNAVTPPSTISSVPVIQLALSESRKTIALATSSA